MSDIYRLACDHFDDRLDADGSAELAAWINASDENAQQFVIWSATHQRLRELERRSTTPAPQVEPITVAGRIGRGYGFAAAIAAALLIVGAAIAAYVVSMQPASDAADDNRTVAVLIGADGVDWSSEPIAPGADVRRGVMAIASGDLSLDMRGGATMTVSGPASFRLLGPDRAQLDRGSISARLPHGSSGLTIVAGNGVWVRDLGTAFTMDVDPAGVVRVDVTEGRVQIGLPGEDEFAASTVELAAGQTVVVDADPAADDRLSIRRLAIDSAEAIEKYGVDRIDWPGESPDKRTLVAVSRPDEKIATPDPAMFTGVTDDGVIRVNSDVRETWGSVWLARKALVADGFESRFAFSFDEVNGIGGADGMSFVVQNHPDGVRLIVGEQGNVVEFGPTVDHALAVEFDSYANAGNGWEPSAAHVSIRHGDELLGKADLAALEPRIENLSGSGRHDVVVRYLAGRMSVEFDGRRILDDVAVDLRSIGAVDADGRAWIGFGARCGGGAAEQHNVHQWSLKTARP